tara:strand:- start:126 stop:452 length:327 start_codon:yes stop_codon:yes gene_type:complete
MSKILRRKSDNVVVYLLADNQSATLSSTKFIFTKPAGGTVGVSDCNSDTHELITGVTAPTTWFGNMMFYADNGTWTINTTALNAENESRQAERTKTGNNTPTDLEVEV